MADLEDLEFAYPTRDQSVMFYALTIAGSAAVASGCVYWTFAVGGTMELRFPGLFKLILRDDLAFAIRVVVSAAII